MCTCASIKEQSDGLIKKGLLSKPQLIAATLYEQSPSAHRILDVGYAQYPNSALRGDVHGVDIYAEEKPANYTAVHYADFNTCSLPFPDASFDAVTMGCVLAHVANPLGFLVELHRVLKPDGVIVLSSPNPNYYWETMLNIFFHHFKSRVSPSKFKEHFFEFSRYNMRTIADRAGFSVVDEVGVSFHVVKLGWTFQPRRRPGLAYEIIYVLKKSGEPNLYTVCELPTGNVELKTVVK